MNDSTSRRSLSPAFLVVALVVALIGCNSRAHNDLYRQRMASEIRVLEDQLYDADYQNRVLRDRLSQCKVDTGAVPARKTIESKPRVQSSDSEFDSEFDTESDMEHGFDSFDDLNLPEVDEGIAVEPDELDTMIDPGASRGPESDASSNREPLKDPSASDSSRSRDSESSELLPAPGGPEPPGKRDIDVPEIVPGELLPPPIGEEDDLKPPGQIQLPDSVQAAAGVPNQLRIHHALSGGHRVEGSITGMVIVVNVIDKLGKPVNLDQFDVDANLSVVVLDPSKDPSEAKIGRWDFANSEVASFVRSKPISGLHIPIDWTDGQPEVDEVIVHVRLRGEEDEMRCEGRLNVEKQAAIAEWTPRGEALR